MSTMRIPLSALRPGDSVVLRVLPDDAETAGELAALRLLPGEDVEVVQVVPLGGPLIVRCAGGLYAVGRPLAERLVVER